LTPNLELFYQPAVCPTPRVTASLMVVPRTTMSLMSGEFGGGSCGGLEVEDVNAS
jgi:hypothetical protein